MVHLGAFQSPDEGQGLLGWLSGQGSVVPHQILEALPVPVYITDAAGNLTYHNEAAAEFWGHRPVIGASRWCGAWRLYWPSGAPMAHSESPLAAALRSGNPAAGEAVAERPDGTRLWFRAFPRPLYDAAGVLVGAVTMLLDITRMREGEAGLQRLAAIVSSSEDAIVSKDLNGIVATWNKGAENLFGYTAEEMIGRSITVLIPEDQPDEEPAILQRIRRGERVEHYETRRRRKDGTLVPISLTISPVRDAEGRIVGASKIARDITARKRAEEALARRAEEQSALFRFTDRLQRSDSLSEVFEAAFDTIDRTLTCTRSSVLLQDAGGVMRFAAWRGLSETYRRAVEGYSPWSPDDRDPKPLAIHSVAQSKWRAKLKTATRAEGIAALAFVPIAADGRLAGMLVACFETPHRFDPGEIDLAITIAHQLGFSLARVKSEEDRRRAEEQRTLLINELNHRVKNTLATVQAIAAQTLAGPGSDREVRTNFEARLLALSRAHSILTDGNWEGAELRHIVEAAVLAHAAPGAIRIEGANIRLTPKAALAIAMGLHELAVNAVKYGALSRADGVVSIVWELTKRPARAWFRLTWMESGGQAVKPPSRKGFGSRLIEHGLARDLGGQARIEYRADGLTCTLEGPLSAIVVSGPNAGPMSGVM